MKLLVATDGSKNSVKAVRQAAKLVQAAAGGGSITLVSVHDDTALRHAQRFVGKETVDNYLRDLSEKDLAESRKALDKAGVKHDMVIRTGHVATEIAALGAKYDMIVMGSKGRTAFKDLLIGSVAQRVLELSKVPMLFVK